MKVIDVSDKSRVMVVFNKDDFETEFIKFRGVKYYKAAEIQLKAAEKKLWDKGFIFQRKWHE